MTDAALHRDRADRSTAPGAWVSWGAGPATSAAPGPTTRERPRPTPAPQASPTRRDEDFIALMRAYRPYRGMARARTLEAMAAGALPAGRLFGVLWNEELWIPMFQLGRAGLSVEAAPQAVLAELAPGFDGWELAQWFVRPNTWLDGLAPIDALDSRLPELMSAARADRYIARG